MDADLSPCGMKSSSSDTRNKKRKPVGMCRAVTADSNGKPAVEDVTSLATQDLIADRHEYLFPLPACLQSAVLPFLRNARDLPLVTFLFNVSVTTLPAAALVFAWKPWSATLGPLYLAATYALYLERFVLALHYSEHSRLFKPGVHVAVHRCCQATRSTSSR